MTDVTKQKRELHVNIDMNEVKTDSNWEAETQVSSKYKQISPTDVFSKILNM